MQKVIELIKPFVVQIATPYSTGTGFYDPKNNLILTNEHVIRGCKELVIQDSNELRYIGTVVFIDTFHDLAIIRPEQPFLEIIGDIMFANSIQMGEEVVALGHPYGLSFSSTFGIISNVDLDIEGISYIMHDAALNPGNSGGPLVNMLGQIVGINSSIFREGKNIGIALKSTFLEESLTLFKKAGFDKGTRCPSCQHIIEDRASQQSSCTMCGTEVSFISNYPDYIPIGIAKRIEDIIERLGFSPAKSRRGQLVWEIVNGSATTHISYHTKSGYLSAESILCNIPSENVIELYSFLLESNYKTKGLTFGVKDKSIILSLVIYDQHLNEESTYLLVKYLLKTSDDYDNILVEKYAATWRK